MRPGLEKPLSRRWERFLADTSFLRESLWKYRWYVGIGLLALVLVDILEIFPPIFIKQAVDIAVDRRPLRYLALAASAYLATALIQGVCRYGWRMYLIRASMFGGRDLRARYSGHLFGLSASFFEKNRIGDLMSLATNDVEAVRQALGPGLLTFADALFYFATVPLAMYWLSPRLTLLAFLPLPIIPWVVFRNEREVHERFEKVQESFGRLSALAQEGLTGIRVVKAFAKEDVQLRRFREEGEEYVRLNLRLARVQTAFGPTLDFAMSLGLVLLLYFGGGHIIRAGTEGADAISLGTFVAFQRYIQKMVWPMAALGMALSSYQRSVSSTGRLKGIFAQRTDVPEAEAPVAPRRMRGEVELRELYFRFPSAREASLQGITLRIEPGERVAFVGGVGSGKSALLSLLPRLYPVERGMLLVDGVDINLWPIDELRRQIGYVSQDVFLFSETVLENVAYGLMNRIDVQEIEAATQLASVHEDILGLSGAYRTRLGERGVNLSGGQKQRLTIARAIAKQPPILVLDDALSAVDVQTEERILAGLRARPGRNTEIIAAHRISTVRDADRIVVLEHGRIRQLGSHRELITDRRGIYRKFYDQQRLKEDLEQYVEGLDATELAPELERGTDVLRT